MMQTEAAGVNAGEGSGARGCFKAQGDGRGTGARSWGHLRHPRRAVSAASPEGGFGGIPKAPFRRPHRTAVGRAAFLGASRSGKLPGGREIPKMSPHLVRWGIHGPMDCKIPTERLEGVLRGDLTAS
jgi:hypothetical protein